jgi:pantoate--beta-alanine ligase
MLIFKSARDIQAWRKSLRDSQSLGFVPTMGALHQGHAELLKKSKAENNLSVLSIYVNKTQFNNSDDFENYPSTWEQDLILAKANQVDVLFSPDYREMYPDNYTYKLMENSLSLDLCGKDRPGHFDGVLTVVMKLFNLVKPTKAYFGEKDFQQLSLILGMTKAFFLDLEVVPVPTVRESSGLALSSRNMRLSADEKEKAPALYKIITSEKDVLVAQEKLRALGFKIDYLKDLELGENGKRRFVAAHLGVVRLIDNVKI